MDIQSEKFSTLVRSILVYSLDFKSHPCRASESVPPGPELPKSFGINDSTTSSLIYTGIKIGVLSYTSNVDKGGGSCKCSPVRTDETVSFITPVSSDASSLGCKNPHVSCSQTNMTASHNFPHRTRLENVLWCCSLLWMPQYLPRYPVA